MSSGTSNASPLRLLLVEDDTDQTRLLTELFKLEGFQVVSCGSVETALAFAQEGDFAVAIVDLSLPDQSGLELARIFGEQGSRTRIIVYTGYGTFDTLKQGLNLRVYAYVEKSDDVRVLIEQVQRASTEYLNETLSQATAELRFQLHLLDSVDEGVIATDVNRRITFSNRFSTQVLGLPEREMRGRLLEGIFTLAGPQSLGDVLHSVADEGRGWSGECMVQVVAPKSAAPSTFPARVTIAPIFDVRQEFKGIVVTYADISAQKAAEEVLIQTAQQHSIAVELGLLALMSDDLETLLAKLSDDILEVIGADLCEVLEISPAGEQVRVRYRKAAIGVALDSPDHAQWRAIEAGSQLEFLRQHRAGVVSEDYSSEKRFRAEPTVMEGGFQSGMSLLIGTWDKPYGILNVYFRGCSKTQSTRIDFLQTLASIVGSFVQRQQAMQRWRALFENTLDAILLTNDSGRYVDANPAACRLLGYSHRELTSLSVRDLYPKELAAAFDDSWQRFIKVGRDTGEAKLVGRDGQEVHVEYRAVANVLPGLHLSGLTDVTARRSSEALIREQQHHLAHVQRTAIMGQMAAVLAHEINQPLGAISNLTGGQLLALEENNASMDELRESLQQVIGQSLRAGEIVRRLRRFVSQSRGVARTVDLNQVIEETVRLVNNDFTLRNTSIRIELVNESLWVQADAIQIQQVLINLLKNSAEAMESVGSPNKRIGIRSWSENAHVVVSVTDSGPGLTEAQARHAFEPYYTTKDDGLGMGLCISRSILDQHRGTIMADATYRDGARFIIRLPRFTGDIHTALSRDASMLQS